VYTLIAARLPKAVAARAAARVFVRRRPLPATT
jgi:hypothetical protein